jgi:hypothetical protein
VGHIFILWQNIPLTLTRSCSCLRLGDEEGQANVDHFRGHYALLPSGPDAKEELRIKGHTRDYSSAQRHHEGSRQ